MEPGCSILGYADDTLVVVTARSIETAEIRANMQVAAVIRRILRSGLKVATDKTEAILFHGRRPARFPIVRVGSDYIQTRGTLKYLGVIFDSRLNFGDHFQYVAAKATKVVSALGRIMPNLRGPSETKRSLYANTVMSVITYAVPVWCDAMSLMTASSRRRQAPVRRVQTYRASGGVSVQICVAGRGITVSAYPADLFISELLPKNLYARAGTQAD